MHEILKRQGNVAAHIERAMPPFVPNCGTIYLSRVPKDRLRPKVPNCRISSIASTSHTTPIAMCSLGSPSKRQAETADTGQLQRRPADVEPQHATEKVEFNPLDPSDRQPEIASERSKHAGAGSCEAVPVAVIRIVLADRRWRQHRVQFRDGVQDRLDEGVGVRTRPRAVVAVGPEAVALDDR